MTAPALSLLGARAVKARCAGGCWAGPGQPCGGLDGSVHLARIIAAQRQGFITPAMLANVLETLIVSGAVFSDHSAVGVNWERTPERKSA